MQNINGKKFYWKYEVVKLLRTSPKKFDSLGIQADKVWNNVHEPTKRAYLYSTETIVKAAEKLGRNDIVALLDPHAFDWWTNP